MANWLLPLALLLPGLAWGQWQPLAQSAQSPVHDAGFALQERQLLVPQDGRLEVIDLNTGAASQFSLGSSEDDKLPTLRQLLAPFKDGWLLDNSNGYQAWNADLTQPQGELPIKCRDPQLLRQSPSQRFIGCGDQVRDLKAQQNHQTLGIGPGSYSQSLFVGDLAYVALAQPYREDSNQVQVLNLADFSSKALLSGKESLFIAAPSVGDFLAVAVKGGFLQQDQVRIFQVPGLAEGQRIKGQVKGLAVSPQGRYLLVAQDKKLRRFLRQEGGTFEELPALAVAVAPQSRQSPQGRAESNSLAFMDDDRVLLVTQQGALQAWDLASGTLLDEGQPHPGTPWRLQWTPTGFAALQWQDGSLKVFKQTP